MSDRTAFQCTITACPEDQQTAAAEVLAQYVEPEYEDDKPAPRYEVADNTLNADGRPIRRGQEALTVGSFATRELAERHIAGLPGADDTGRYSIDEVPGLAIDFRYFADEVSCGSASECADNLIDAAPGCSFVLWEDPKYEWLGTVCAYTPELGLYSADCDANGVPVFDATQIMAWIGKAAETGEGVIDYIDRATGGPWLRAKRRGDPGRAGQRVRGLHVLPDAHVR